MQEFFLISSESLSESDF